MNTKLPQRNSSGSYGREARAARRLGPNAQCACGEARPLALVEGSNPIICAECDRIKTGKSTMDEHHFAGKKNHTVTTTIPANDHRAVLSPAQYDWPKETRENPGGSPLLAGAACIRGFIDTVVHLIEKGLFWVAEMLEKLDAFLVQSFGRKWWDKTELAHFTPRSINYVQR